MRRKYILLLASLLMTWGLASCEKSDSDDETPTLNVRLSKSEVTADNGKASVEVTVDGFAQLAYLEITKTDDTKGMTEKYMKASLSEKYIYEYTVKENDDARFTLEFVAVGSDNKSSEAVQLMVNRGTVNVSKALAFTNLKCVSRITGAEVNGVNGLPAVEFEVNNRTNELYNVGGTDLGIVWELQPGRYGLFFGDTFGSDFYPNFVNPGPNGGSWRSNVLLFSEDTKSF